MENKKELVYICIPIYKKFPLEDEIVSFKQAIKILKKYKFKIVSPFDLDLSYYEHLLRMSEINYEICSFDKFYFNGVERYNRLMLSKEFYQRFSSAEYILIYQLDAFVFKDELEYWCSLDYDYIGAPWLEDYSREVVDDTIDVEYWMVGNGGFSLRKVKLFIEKLNFKKPVMGAELIWNRFSEYSFFKKILRFPVTVCKIIGYKNTMEYFSSFYPYNEDAFWCVFLKQTQLALNIPNIDVAIKFSLEIGAKKIVENNNNQLPFGCHAWNKYEKDFWSQHIE